MNTDGCPPGLFTDEILLYHPTVQCSESTAAWQAVAFILAILRCLVFIPHYISIGRKLKRRQPGNTSQPSTSRRYTPLAILRIALELLAGLMQLCFVIFSTLNLASTRNGISPLLFSLYLLLIACGQIMDIRVVVKLGRRIIPFALPGGASGSNNGNTGSSSEDSSELANADGVLKLVGSLALAFLVGAQVLVVVLGPVYAGQAWTLRAGLACMLGYIVCMSLFMCWHVQRCVSAIRVLCLNMKEDTKIQRTIVTFRRMQGMICAFSGVSTLLIVLLIDGSVLPFHWPIIVVVFMFAELMFELGMVASMFSQRHKKTRGGGGDGAGGSKQNDLRGTTSNKTNAVLSSVASPNRGSKTTAAAAAAAATQLSVATSVDQ